MYKTLHHPVWLMGIVYKHGLQQLVCRIKRFAFMENQGTQKRGGVRGLFHNSPSPVQHQQILTHSSGLHVSIKFKDTVHAVVLSSDTNICPQHTVFDQDV